jgi:hypothetical protein
MRAANPAHVQNIDRLALLEGMVADVIRRLDALEGLKRRKTPDPETDAALLSAIAGAVGGAVFAVADLFAIHDPELQVAIAGETAYTLGIRLRGLRRRPCGPYRLRRAARASAGALWHLGVEV